MNQSMKENTKHRVRLSKVLLNLILSAAIIFGSVPCKPFVMEVKADTPAEKTITGLGLGTIMTKPNEPEEGYEGWSGSRVYFGKYAGKPMKYRVLASSENMILLDCDNILKDIEFSTNNNNSWKESEVRSWLQGDEFYNNTDVFTAAEKNAIHAGNEEIEGIDDVTIPEDYTIVDLEDPDPVFVLNVSAVTNSRLGYYNDTDYSNTRAKYFFDETASKRVDWWWLRSKGNDPIDGYNTVGTVYDTKVRALSVIDEWVGVSPALYLDTAPILYSSLVEGSEGQAGSEYKLTVKDEGLSVSYNNVEGEDDTISVSYTFEDKSESADPTQISVVVTDKEWDSETKSNEINVIQYTKLEMDSFGSSGTGTFTLDSTLGTWGEDYHVYILAEDVNGTYETDYASEPVELKPTVQASAEDVEVTYDGKPHSISVNIAGDTEGVTVKYGSSADDCTKDLGDLAITKVSDSPREIFYKASKPGCPSASGSATVKINKAKLIVSALDSDIIYGEEPQPSDPPVQYGIKDNFGNLQGGFVNGEDESVLGGELGFDYTYKQYDDVGEYLITPKGLTSDNYDIQFEPGRLWVYKATHPDVNVSGNAAYGTEGILELKDRIEAGGTLGEVSIEGEEEILDGSPVIDGTKLRFKFKNVPGNVGKKVKLTIPVSNPKNYGDYNIIAELEIETPYSIDKTELTLSVNEKATINLKNGAEVVKAKNWNTSNHEVATVVDGVVTGLVPGTATITATAPDDVIFECNVTVKKTLVKVNSISISGKSTIYTGDDEQFTATVSPDNADNKEVNWSSSNPEVAKVDNTGLVSGLKNGTVKITATATDGSGKKASCTVTVKTKVTKLDISAPAGSDNRVAIGKSITMDIKYNNGDSIPTDKTIMWASTDSGVATVSQKGVVKGLSAGETEIKAVSADGSVEATPVTIRVYEPVTAVKLDNTSMNIGSGESFKLTATLTPVNKDDDDEYQGVTFTIDPADESYMTITPGGDGLSASIKANEGSVGKSVKIYATAKDGSGKRAVCTVKIGAGVEGVSVTAPKNQNTIAKGKTLKLKATVTPDKAQNKGVTWTSSVPSVATVDKNGVVKAIAASNDAVTITATSVANGEKTATYTIFTYDPLTKIALDQKSLTLKAGASYQLVTTLTPENATYIDGTTSRKSSDSIEYKVTSGPDFIDIDKTSRVITAKDESALDGKSSQNAVVTVTVTGANGTVKSAKCSVKVVRDDVKVSSVKLNNTKLSIGTGAKAVLGATTAPVTATDKKLIWTVDSGKEYIDVDYNEDGSIKADDDGTIVISGKEAGKAKITATATDGSKKKATCMITVGNPVDNVTVSGSKDNKLVVGKNLTLKAAVKGSADGKVKAANTSVTWSIVSAKKPDGTSVEDTSTIATISNKGVVSAKSAGTVVIRATAETPNAGEAKYGEYTLTTYVPVSKITADRTKATISEGYTGTVSVATLLPENATNKDISWTSSNKDIIEIADYNEYISKETEEVKSSLLVDSKELTSDKKLLFKGVGAGTAKITGITTDGSKKKITITVKVIGRMKKADVKLDVKSIPNGISVTEESRNTENLKITNIPVNKSVTLKPSLTKTAADKAVTYRTSDANVATVTSGGVIKAVGAGDATITMRTSDGGYEATCTVKVSVP